jgi:hypothetical protein
MLNRFPLLAFLALLTSCSDSGTDPVLPLPDSPGKVTFTNLSPVARSMMAARPCMPTLRTIQGCISDQPNDRPLQLREQSREPWFIKSHQHQVNGPFFNRMHTARHSRNQNRLTAETQRTQSFWC